MANCKSMILVLLLGLSLAGSSCSGTMSFGVRDRWYDGSDYSYRHRHDQYWYWDDYDGDGVINGHDDYPYDSWWW